MSFKQLASLRDQLAQQAAAEKKQKQQQMLAPPAKKAETVDPIVLIIGQLQKQFPKSFPKNPAPKVPLKIGIHKDLIELSENLGISKTDLRQAIKTWCCGNRYWASVIEDAIRLDLKGDPAGRVTKEEAALAIGLKNRQYRKKRNAKIVSCTASA